MILVSDDIAKVTAMVSAKFVKGKPYMPWEIQSLVEKEIISKVKTQQERQFWLNHHKQYFIRVYPKGTRFDNSNYNHFPGWAIGSQVVALNLQTKDEFELLNYSYFMQHGGYHSGYVLRSPLLLGESIQQPPKKIKLSILSGSQMPKKRGDAKDIIDPFVQVKLYSTAFPNEP